MGAVGVRIDTSAHSCVVVCSCGARFVAASRAVALTEAAQHEATTHSTRDARDRLARL